MQAGAWTYHGHHERCIQVLRTAAAYASHAQPADVVDPKPKTTDAGMGVCGR